MVEEIIGNRIVGVAHRALKRNAISWHNTPGTLSNTLNEYMKKTNWKNTGPWQWTQNISGKTQKVNLTNNAPDNLAKTQHELREAYRQKQWQDFLNSKRRDAEIITLDSKPPYPTKAAEKLRKMGQDIAPELRAVVVGSFYTIAASESAHLSELAKQRKEHYDPYKNPPTPEMLCPWCDTQAACTWNHCAWECPNRTPKIRTPTCPLQKRMAWPTNPSDSYNEQVFQVAKAIVRKTWTFKHGKSASTADRLGAAGGSGQQLSSSSEGPLRMSLGEMRSAANVE